MIAQQFAPIPVPLGHYVVDTLLYEQPHAVGVLNLNVPYKRLIITFNPDRLNWLPLDIEANMEQQGLGVLNDHDPHAEEQRLIEKFFTPAMHTLIVSSRKLNSQVVSHLLLSKPHCADQVLLDSLYWPTLLPSWNKRFGDEWLTTLLKEPAIVTAKQGYVTLPMMSHSSIGNLSQGVSINLAPLKTPINAPKMTPMTVRWRWNEYFKWQGIEQLITEAPAGSTVVLTYQYGLPVDDLLDRVSKLGVRHCHFVKKSTATEFEQLQQFMTKSSAKSIMVIPYDVIALLPLPLMTRHRPAPWQWICWHPPWNTELLMNISMNAGLPDGSTLTIFDCFKDTAMLKNKRQDLWPWAHNVNPYKESLQNLEQLLLQSNDCMTQAWCRSQSVTPFKGSPCDSCKGCTISPYSSSKWMKKLLQRLF